MSELRRLVMTGYNRFMQTEWAAVRLWFPTACSPRVHQFMRRLLRTLP